MHTRQRVAIGATAVMALSGGALGPAALAQDSVELSYLVDSTEATSVIAQALADAFMAQNPNVTITLEVRPQGGPGDDLVKTRLATGEMNDVFWYNAGSLFQALSPTESMLEITDEPFIANISEGFLPAVTADGGIYGVPSQDGMGGGILYNKTIYEDLGLPVPTTWEEFAANNEAIKAAGIAPVGASYAGDSTWTSQLFVLADYYNVQAAVPDFAEQYTNNQIKYATTPEALAGFQHLQEAFEKGWYQEDFGATTYADALGMLAAGEIAHYPMLSFALGEIAALDPEAAQNIGFFGQPGADPENHGATLWAPAATYIAANTEHPDEAKAFLGFIASVEGTQVMAEAIAPSGPYLIKGATLPDDVLPAVHDIQAYIDSGKSAPALEFVSPVKGPRLEQITVEVGSGLRSAEDGAALYDQDVETQAKQLGLPGW
jgi:raffinose/stachyose/melibiose transport system substrate-binding protein